MFTVDSVIATIAEPDFSSKAGLSDLDELLSVVRTKGDADTFINLFVKKNGPEILQSWLKNFLNISEEKHDYVKSYCGRLLNFICFGCYYAKFVHYIFDTSILADYVRFTFSPILFNDSSFTGQVLQVALLTMHKIQVRTVGNTMQQMFTKYFGDDLSILENRLKSETASFPKLLFKTLLIQNLTDLNSIDSDWLSLSCSDIKNLSALIFSENVNYKIDFRSYFNFVIELPVYWIQREFNKLLSAETNRQCLCRRGIFDFFFNGIFSLPMTTKYFNPYPYLEVVIPCLRRLVIIAQSCVQYSQYFNRTHSKSKQSMVLLNMHLRVNCLNFRARYLPGPSKSFGH